MMLLEIPARTHRSRLSIVDDPEPRFPLVPPRGHGRDAHGNEERVTGLLDASPNIPHQRRSRGGIALINSVGNLGGLVGPTIMGQVEGTNGDYTIGYLILVAALLLGAFWF